MQVGDLVRLKRPTTTCFNKVFLVTEVEGGWVKVQSNKGWQPITDFEVVNASR